MAFIHHASVAFFFMIFATSAWARALKPFHIAPNRCNEHLRLAKELREEGEDFEELLFYRPEIIGYNDIRTNGSLSKKLFERRPGSQRRQLIDFDIELEAYSELVVEEYFDQVADREFVTTVARPNNYVKGYPPDLIAALEEHGFMFVDGVPQFERTRHVKDLTRKLVKKISRSGREELTQIVRESVEFAQKHYTRRIWANGTFLKEMWAVAKKYLSQSTYIQVRQRPLHSYLRGDLVATLRSISAEHSIRLGSVDTVFRRLVTPSSMDLGLAALGEHPIEIHGEWLEKETSDRGRSSQGASFRTQDLVTDTLFSRGKKKFFRVPMEETLDTFLTRKCVPTISSDGKDVHCKGELKELGLFAIDKAQIKGYYPEVMMNIRHVLDPDRGDAYNFNAVTFVTYNDLPKLYTRMGFERVRGPTVRKYGVKWVRLEAKPVDVLHYLHDLQYVRNVEGNTGYQKYRNLMRDQTKSKMHGASWNIKMRVTREYYGRDYQFLEGKLLIKPKQTYHIHINLRNQDISELRFLAAPAPGLSEMDYRELGSIHVSSKRPREFDHDIKYSGPVLLLVRDKTGATLEVLPIY